MCSLVLWKLTNVSVRSVMTHTRHVQSNCVTVSCVVTHACHGHPGVIVSSVCDC